MKAGQENGHYPAGIYLLKVNNRNTRTRCEICSKLTIKTPEKVQENEGIIQNEVCRSCCTRTGGEFLAELLSSDDKKKYKKMKESFKMKFAEAAAPGQEGSSWQNYCPRMTMRVMIGKTKFQKNWTVFSQNFKVEMPWKNWSSFPS